MAKAFRCRNIDDGSMFGYNPNLAKARNIEVVQCTVKQTSKGTTYTGIKVVDKATLGAPIEGQSEDDAFIDDGDGDDEDDPNSDLG